MAPERLMAFGLGMLDLAEYELNVRNVLDQRARVEREARGDVWAAFADGAVGDAAAARRQALGMGRDRR